MKTMEDYVSYCTEEQDEQDAFMEEFKKVYNDKEYFREKYYRIINN